MGKRFCSIESKTKIYFFSALSVRINLMSGLMNIDNSLPTENDEKLLDLLCGNSKFNMETNQNILNFTLKL